MSKSERRIIIIILVLIIILSCYYIYVIKSGSKYDKNLYNEIYSEYNQIFNENQKEENVIAIDSGEKRNVVSVKVNSSKKTADYKVDGKITIPKIDLQYPIICETNEEYLKIAPTKLFGPEINEIGNYCIVGHNFYDNKLFSRLSELEIGDDVNIVSNKGKNITYSVYNKYEIDETDMECTNQNTDGNIELTLITCTKNKNNRLVVKCKAVI